MVNSDLIKYVENAPDTVLTLVTGEKLVVREASREVLQKIVEFRRSIYAGLPLPLLPPAEPKPPASGAAEKEKSDG